MGSLIVRTVAGFLFLMLAMALALLLPAGSLSFWQGWVYLAVFGSSTILITAYLFRYDQRLLASRTKAGPVAETQRSQRIIQSIAALCFIAIFVVPGLDHRFHWSSVSPAISLAADALVALGFFFVFLVFRENSFTSATIEVASDQKVIATGPYRLVRHPMYSGSGLLVLATPIALGSLVGIPLAVVLIAAIAARAVKEEKFLAANLSGYEEYRQKVRYRLIPYVW